MVASLQSKNDTVNQTNGLFQLEVDELKMEVNMLRNEAKMQTGNIEQMKRRVSEVEASRKSTEEVLNAKVKSFEDTISSLQQSLESLQKKYDKAVDENNSGSRHIGLLEKLNQVLRSFDPKWGCSNACSFGRDVIMNSHKVGVLKYLFCCFGDSVHNAGHHTRVIICGLNYASPYWIISSE